MARSVFQVLVSFGRRRMPHEYHFRAPNAGTAMRLGLRRAREDGLARPHGIAGVLHLCDLDRPARRLRRVR